MRGNLCLLTCALIWGVAFIFQKGVTDDLDALTFNTFRFAIASLALATLFFLPKRLFVPNKKSLADIGVDLRPAILRHRHSDVLVGAIAGVTMFFGISLQQWGLELTTAGKSGFITSLYIIAVPILGLFIGQRCGREIVIAVLLAVIGFYFIGRDDMLKSGSLLSGLNQGDWLTLITIFFWGIQVIILGLGAKNGNLLVIATTQFIIVTLLSTLGLLLFFALGKLHWVGFDVLWKHRDAFVYTGVISTSVAFMLQLFGQKTVPTANAALILSLEGVFAAIAGVIFLTETVTVNILTGFTIIFIAVLLAQWRDMLPLVTRFRRK